MSILVSMLVHYSTLKSTNNLAAIRFTNQLSIQKITIFPSDTKPFKNADNLVARTEPPSFFVNLWFNASALKNALLPTSIGYPGGIVDFVVDMGQQVSIQF